MNPNQQAQAWKHIITECNKIEDPVLRQSYIQNLRLRALNEWGYNPDDGKVTIDLLEWEKEFIDRIKQSARFDIYESNTELERETQIEMLKFIEDGGTISDLPDELKTPYIIDLYNQTLTKYFAIRDNEFEGLISQIKPTEDNFISLGDAAKQVLQSIK